MTTIYHSKGFVESFQELSSGPVQVIMKRNGQSAPQSRPTRCSRGADCSRRSNIASRERVELPAAPIRLGRSRVVLLQLVFAPQVVSPAMAADVCGGSAARTPGSASADDWSAEGLLFALSRAEELQLRLNVWIAVNAPEELAAAHPEHTLCARLGISSTVLPVLWSTAFGSDGIAAASLAKKLNDVRSAAGLSPRLYASKMRSKFGSQRVTLRMPTPSHMYSMHERHTSQPVSCSTQPRLHQVTWFALQLDATELSSTPHQQLQDSSLPQPAPLSATHRVLATWAARKRLRSSGDAMETEQAQSATPAAATEPPVFVQATPRMSVSVILTALGASKPFVDASGERLPDSLLGRTCSTAEADGRPCTRSVQSGSRPLSA